MQFGIPLCLRINTSVVSACVYIDVLLQEDEQASGPIGDALGPQRPRSNSGRELTDEVCFLVSLFHSSSLNLYKGALLLSTHTFLSVCF